MKKYLGIIVFVVVAIIGFISFVRDVQSNRAEDKKACSLEVVVCPGETQDFNDEDAGYYPYIG